MASSSSETESGSGVEQFCAVTGADRTTAQRLLDACNGNVEMAIGMHIDGGGGDAPSCEEGVVPSDGDDSCPLPPDDSVRAPIPQKHEVLVQENYGFVSASPPPRRESFLLGLRGRRKAARSVFDGFRDFQAEAKQQEQALAGTSSENGARSVRKRKTLEDLFRPPIDLTFKGSFHSARDAGTANNKWLMVNIQNVQEFPCQVLNRDVWSHPGVKALVNKNFILWQVYHDSEEGKKYSQFYKITEWPYIAILDPRTGENMCVWNKMDATIFCDLVSAFLERHSIMEGSSHSPPKKLRKDSIVDASEDSQLEAAIQASLCESTSPTANKPRLNSMEAEAGFDSDNVSDEGEDDLETFTDSDSEGHPSPVKSNAGKCSEKNKNTPTKRELPKISSMKYKTNIDEISKDRSDTLDGISSCSKTNIDKKADCVDSSSQDSSATNDSQKEEKVSKWTTYLGSEDDPKSEIMIRFPDGKRKQWKVSCTSKLMALVQYVIEHGYSNERYELVTTFPRRKLSYIDFNTTLKENGLFPQETVFVQER